MIHVIQSKSAKSLGKETKHNFYSNLHIRANSRGTREESLNVLDENGKKIKNRLEVSHTQNTAPGVTTENTDVFKLLKFAVCQH